MKKQSKRRSALLMSFASLLLCFAMLVSTTFAWFTDSVTSGVNQIIAGNLDIEVYREGNTLVSSSTKLFDDVTRWEPGAVAYENITVKNVGSLAAKYVLSLNVAEKNTLNGHDLTEVIKVAVVPDGFYGGRAEAQTLNGYQTLESFTKNGTLDATTGAETFGIVLYWAPTDNDNIWNANNGQKTSDGNPLFVNVGITVVATQQTEEVDSFDKQYDVNATYPVLGQAVNMSQQQSVTVNADGTLAEAVELNGVTIPASTKLFTAEGNVLTTEALADGKLKGDIKTTAQTENSMTLDISYTYVHANGTTNEIHGFSSALTHRYTLSKGLKNVTVTHGGTAMTAATSESSVNDGQYFYNPTTGELTIVSSTYSEYVVSFESDFEAAVSGQGYATLEEAISAANENDIVALLKDITLTTKLGINKKVTIDLNGKTINANAVQYPININEGSDVIFMDSVGSGGITQTYSKSSANIFEVSSKLTVNGGTYTTNGTYGVFYRYSGCELYINNGIFNAGKPVGGSSGTVAFNGGYFSNKFDAPVGYKLEEVDLNGAVYYRLVLLAEEDAVASITRDSTVIYFDSLDAAIKNAAATESIVLLKDATLPEEYSLSKVCTVNLNGKTVTPSIESCESLNYYAVTENDICTVCKIGKWSENAAESYATPIAENVVTIASAGELALFAKQVNAGTSYSGFTVKLTADIDLSKNAWDKPIGMNGNRFGGTFDGQNHTISNMKATSSPSYGNGLFADMNPNASIKNLTISNAYVGGSGNIYGIVSGYAYGTVTFENITVKDSYVGGYGKVGGILGMAADPSGTTRLVNCVVKDTVIAGTYNCGGLIGLAQNEVALSGCSTDNVIWKKGDTNSKYLDVNAEFTKGTGSCQLAGMYWKYRYGNETYLFAAWGDYYTDLYYEDYAGTINGQSFLIADGGCHNK